MKKLICIGDSHASFFSGTDKIQPIFPEKSEDLIDGMESVRLGAVLAYSLSKTGTREKGREKMLQKLSVLSPDQHSILLCFGEIDCRTHLLRQAELKGLKLSKVIDICLDNYFSMVIEIKNKGFQLFVWNAIPTTYSNNSPEYPNFGTHKERNECTALFNRMAENRCNEIGVVFINIFDKLVTKRNNTRGYYLFDDIHLGQLAMPFFLKYIQSFFPDLAENKIKKYRWLINYISEWKKNKIRKYKFRLKKIMFKEKF